MTNPWGAPGVWTSGRRTHKGNRLVGGVANSAHLRGEAADFAGVSEAQLRKHFGPKVNILNGGDHLHVAGLKDVPYHGKRGTAGLVNGVDTTAPKGNQMFQPNPRRLPVDPITAALGRMTPVQGGVDPLAPQMPPQPPQMGQQMPMQRPMDPAQQPDGPPNLAAMSGYSSIRDPLAPKPKAFGKGGAGWAILGALGDAMMAYGGQKGVYAPAMADLASQDRQEKFAREKMNMEAQQRLAELQAKANEPPAQIQLANYLNSMDPAARTKALGALDMINPHYEEYTDVDGNVRRRLAPRAAAAESAPPMAGHSEDGYVFLGGDPADPKNWSKQ